MTADRGRKTATRNQYVRIDAIGTYFNGALGGRGTERKKKKLTQFVLLISDVFQFFVELTGKASSGEGVRGRSCRGGEGPNKQTKFPSVAGYQGEKNVIPQSICYKQPRNSNVINVSHHSSAAE